MKKFILPLLLLLAIGMLAAVESDPSAVVGYVKYDCVVAANGSNNLIALPMDTGYTMASDLGDAYPGVITAITQWVPSTQTWSAASFNGTSWFGDFALAPSMSYMVTVTEAVSVYSIGDMFAPATYNLVSVANGSNNLIMVPLNESGLATASALGTDIGVANAVSTWLPASQTWSAASYNGTSWFGEFDISIATPLMVTVTENTSWGAAATKTAPSYNSRSRK
ncbi:MAG: hypothetical protein PHY48_07365 [Candidatus Cloacimonetes bacterium]|nr:hypothetical protein [Candidatus Cloacimonadota bacterium]